MKNAPVYIGVIVGILVLALLYFFWSNRDVKYQWVPTLQHNSKQPYGLSFVKEMLASYRDDGEFTVNQKWPLHKLFDKVDVSKGKTDLVVIGHSVYLDQADITALKRFLRDGNNLFIATSRTPTAVLDSLYAQECSSPVTYESVTDSIVNTNFYHENFHRSSDFQFRFRVFRSDLPYPWNFVNGSAICAEMQNLTPLGYIQSDRVNFFKITYEGNGNIFVHTDPIMFANYFMIQSDKVDYVSAVFSHLTGKDIIWDEVSKLPREKDEDNRYDSPLYYIMQQPALKYAWWMLLAGSLLYIIFASKRMQRVIPVIEPKTNTSLEFLNVISSLHYQNPNHLDMARKKMKYFLYFIRARYGINTQTFTEEQVKRLAERSKVDHATIQEIHDRYKVIEHYSISNEEPERLVGLYQAIEKFYKNCK